VVGLPAVGVWIVLPASAGAGDGEVVGIGDGGSGVAGSGDGGSPVGEGTSTSGDGRVAVAGTGIGAVVSPGRAAAGPGVARMVGVVPDAPGPVGAGSPLALPRQADSAPSISILSASIRRPFRRVVTTLIGQGCLPGRVSR
jgi:hypothetical protein